MSPRNFARVFTRQVGMAPRAGSSNSCVSNKRSAASNLRGARYCRSSRRFGDTTAEGMRLAFDRHLGVSPREYRRRFSSSTVM